MRIESSRPMGNGGWFHLSGGTCAGSRTVCRKTSTTHTGSETQADQSAQNFKALLTAWRFNRSNSAAMDHLANELGVTHNILEDLGICYSDYYHAYAFPMSVPTGEVVGIRLRNSERKWSVKGSHSALFIPWNAFTRLPHDILMICEGPTDTAAAMKLGFFAIGRPACRGCEEMVVTLLRQWCPKQIIVALDNDDPGIRGAEELIKRLHRPVTRFIPPTKDLREFVNLGGTRELLQSIISNTVRA